MIKNQSLTLEQRASKRAELGQAIALCIILNTVFARSVAAATNVFNLSWREATIQERLLFESGVYLFDCALPQETN